LVYPAGEAIQGELLKNMHLPEARLDSMGKPFLHADQDMYALERIRGVYDYARSTVFTFYITSDYSLHLR